MKLVNAGCGPHYAEGWVNCDVWVDKHTKPDVQVTPKKPYPFRKGTVDAVYMGHVLEHMPWKDVPRFLKDMLRICKPDAPLLIVGPDVYRSIACWARGTQPWHIVVSTLEHLDHNYQPDREDEVWDQAHHHWNCHEQRVADLLHQLGVQTVSYTDRIPHNPAATSWYDSSTDITWPVVGYHEWQFAIMAYAH